MKKTEQPQSFLVAGLGRFGGQIALQLAQEGGTVLAIDIDPDKVESIKDQVARAVCLDAANTEAMQSVGAFDLDVAIIAFPGRFDKSVLVTHALKRHGLHHIIVRVTTNEEAAAIMAVGATEVVFPERDIAHHMANRLLNPELADQIPLTEHFAVLEIPCPEAFVGKTLEELHLRRKFGLTLIALKTMPEDPLEDGKITLAPNSDEPLTAGKHLLLLGDRKRLKWFTQRMTK